MRALGRTMRDAVKADKILQGILSKRLPVRRICQHTQRCTARDVKIFIRDGHLASIKEGEATLLADYVVFCPNPCCEHVFEVQFHGFKVRTSVESRQAVA